MELVVRKKYFIKVIWRKIKKRPPIEVSVFKVNICLRFNYFDRWRAKALTNAYTDTIHDIYTLVNINISYPQYA